MIKKQPLVRVVAFIRRNPTLTQDEFVEYWKSVHVPLVLKILEGLVRYTGSFPLPVKSAPQAIVPDIDAVVELCFRDVASMQKAMLARRSGVRTGRSVVPSS